MSLTLFSGPFGGSDSQTGGDRWRVTMRSLWDYLRRDMRDAEVQQKKLYPRNWKKHVLRTVPFVWALARELATAYVQEPGRRWTDLDGNPLSGATQRLIAAEYKRARVNRIMRHAHRQLIALNSATIWSWPDPASSGVSLQLIPPHEQEVQMATPFGLSEDSVEFWRFRVPLPMPPDPQLFTWAIAAGVDPRGDVDAERTDRAAGSRPLRDERREPVGHGPRGDAARLGAWAG
jgi:hypothetical protein